MPHAVDQDEFRAADGISGRSRAACVAHAVGEAVDHKRRDVEMPEAFGTIAESDGRDTLTSDCSGIIRAVVGASLHSRRPISFECPHISVLRMVFSHTPSAFVPRERSSLVLVLFRGILME